MRVLLTVHQFFPHFAAGTEVLTLSVAQGLRARGHVVRILTAHPEETPLSDAGRFDTYEYDGFPVTRFRYGRVPMGAQRSVMELEYDNHLVARRMRRLLSEFRPDVVHFLHLQRLSASVIDECFAARVPTVLTPTDFWFLCPTSKLQLPDGSACEGPDEASLNCLRHLVSLTQPRPIRLAVWATPDSLLRPLVTTLSGSRSLPGRPIADVRALRYRRDYMARRLAQIDLILAPTRMLKRLFLGVGIAEDRIVLCPYGVTVPHADAPRHAHDGTLVMTYIGTLARPKGAHVAIGAVRRLTPHVNVRLDVYGDLGDQPGYARQLERIAGSDPRITFLGTFPNTKLGDVLAGTDVLVVPSTWRENSPLVLLSAQAVGRPVIGSNVEGIAEVIEHERNGLLFPAGDVDALARAMSLVASDRNLLARLSAEAVTPRTAERYTEDVERAYQSVLAARGAA